MLVRIEPHRGSVPAGTSVRAYLLDAATLEHIPTPRSFIAAIAVVGQKNAGKTTLIERLSPLLQAAGVRVGMIKHHAHQDALDDSRRDTGRVASAGVARTLLVGPHGIVDRRYAAAGASLTDALQKIEEVDLVFVEGFAESSLPKILVKRAEVTSERAVPAGPYLAVVGDVSRDDPEPRFGWDDLDALALFLR